MNNRSMAQRSQKQEIYTTSKKARSPFALLLILSLKAHLSTASDTMYRGQPLAWNQNLTSKSGIFELGFFTPGKSDKYYKGRKLSPSHLQCPLVLSEIRASVKTNLSGTEK
ncbi:hypothetical protein CMV_025411 [Castanea mollissima]|uniref:Uncharacterized protein n=1 Tax=Castanea mollissima TaxID=60419 RepID=A0A8J4QLL8_9ROSI|nr:hypothetical protein CMV_025411 [Castanea mollissima]